MSFVVVVVVVVARWLLSPTGQESLIMQVHRCMMEEEFVRSASTSCGRTEREREGIEGVYSERKQKKIKVHDGIEIKINTT